MFKTTIFLGVCILIFSHPLMLSHQQLFVPSTLLCASETDIYKRKGICHTNSKVSFVYLNKWPRYDEMLFSYLIFKTVIMPYTAHRDSLNKEIFIQTTNILCLCNLLINCTYLCHKQIHGGEKIWHFYAHGSRGTLY